MNRKKATIGVFFGSRSPEHDISIITAELIISGLKGLEYPVIPVYFAKDGTWYINEKLGNLSFFQTDIWDFKNWHRYYLDLENSKEKIVLKQKGIFGKKVVIEIAFPAFHGQYGEDGTIQGLWETFNVPYIGCDVSSCALAKDKVFTKLIYQANQIPTVNFVYFYNFEWNIQKEKILKEIETKLNYPLFVKPARLGSSIGIKKVKNQNELEEAIEVALHYDEKVLVENGIENVRDLTCAVLGNFKNPFVSLVQESLYEVDFFTFEDKYLKGGGAQTGKARQKIVIPAEIPNKLTEEIQKLAKEIFIMFGGTGISRIDFLYDEEENKLYANEINPLPGTLYHHLFKKSGVEFPQLLQKLIDLALERHKEKQQLITTFNSSVLKSSNLKEKLKL
ncbi:MAG TPA: D-alanine--D-alanine ligase family protein [Candidatus Paceibacterota bacterium]|nr:D-alanine--D-alanine ligase family protein [Candidatus Paceibacterota bacterium]HOK97235.1 D-alanine--D-alanine ligase family protein [Candidatus Paceibacterota bacterium]HPP64574.1 D-alanine--D-alanine ligase family protein [Candidatus Paceibacterota bacterium]